MKNYRLLRLFLTVLTLLLAFTSCSDHGTGETQDTNKEPDSIPLLDESGKPIYRIVRPDIADDSIVSATVRLRKAIDSFTGTESEMKTDFLLRGEELSSFSGIPEILVGRTNRPESEEVFSALPENGYEIRKTGNKIVIVGKDDICTVAAISVLINTAFLNDNGNFSLTGTAFKSGVYSVTDGAINGTYFVNRLDGWYKSQGRTFLNENGLALLCSSASFEFSLKCEGKVAVTVNAKNVTEGDNWGVFFTGYVDGNRLPQRLHVTKSGTTELVLAEDLPYGEHTFAIVRQTEWDRGDTYAYEILTEGAIAAPPAEKELYFEFIGDSLTTGFGNLSDVEGNDWGGAPIYQDSTRSYCQLTADAFDADYSVVAIQGIGVVCGPQTIVMGDVYPEYPRVNEHDYLADQSRKADVVVINMGTNDWETKGGKGVSDDVILDKLMELGLQAKEMHPDTKIVYVTGMQPSYTRQLENVVKDLGGSENGFYYCRLPENLKGHDSHPDLDGHRAAADTLIAFLTEQGICG